MINLEESFQPGRKGFFTDTSICIGCKACEVACKEWNRNPADSTWQLSDSSYDNTTHLGADTWRHVAFVEQGREQIEQARESGRRLVNLGMPTRTPGTVPGVRESNAGDGSSPAEDLSGVDTTPPDTPDFRWLMASDVCKHCTHAGCLDVCPTGALMRTEFGTVVVQDDVCNGCGYCVPACPFGVIERRDRPTDANGERLKTAVKNEGVAQKCTLCYDRLEIGAKPACAQACPTTSIQFGDLSEMRQRVAALNRNLGLPNAFVEAWFDIDFHLGRDRKSVV